MGCACSTSNATSTPGPLTDLRAPHSSSLVVSEALPFPTFDQLPEDEEGSCAEDAPGTLGNCLLPSADRDDSTAEVERASVVNTLGDSWGSNIGGVTSRCTPNRSYLAASQSLLHGTDTVSLAMDASGTPPLHGSAAHVSRDAAQPPRCSPSLSPFARRPCAVVEGSSPSGLDVTLLGPGSPGLQRLTLGPRPSVVVPVLALGSFNVVHKTSHADQYGTPTTANIWGCCSISLNGTSIKVLERSHSHEPADGAVELWRSQVVEPSH